MNRFDYYDLSSFLKHGSSQQIRNYVQELQAWAMHLESIIGNRNQIIRQREEQIAELQRTVATLEAERDGLRKQLAGLRENQRVDHRGKDRARDERGRLLPTGHSREDSKRTCYNYFMQGYDSETIALMVGNLSKSSVEVYIREVRAEERKKKQLEDIIQKNRESERVYMSRYADII